ncbi:MAG: DnaA regulatory inactivator Hda [Salinisphaera sp.]|nr:DnaA regulatory inactivator Hda [Salinisphaera sp.]
MSGEMVQLPLGIQLRETAELTGFQPGANAQAVAAVREAAAQRGQRVYLWGAQGRGKSHLLQAAVRFASESGEAAAYLPMADLMLRSPALLEGLGGMALVCVDDVQALAGQRDWEQALTGALDSWRAANCSVVAAGPVGPAGLSGLLADLRTRLGWGAVYALRELDESDKQEVLRRRAAARGLELPGEVGQYLLRRNPRSLPGLLELLERLDHASLVAQRRLTIPFVREVLQR